MLLLLLLPMLTTPQPSHSTVLPHYSHSPHLHTGTW
ncbi:hypothetical protein M758_3G187500 [Ceratodon purpureus]|nr:hypothetical protein M758_3G187500 [Ceratodon purpureus]